MIERVLVAGGAGFLGSAPASRLCGRNVDWYSRHGMSVRAAEG
jgi:nucleoside-diphosphate-sugar epimerase